jgi:trehalose 6-phosphate phosphatase
VLRSDEQPQVESFVKTVERASRSLLLLDYDGTLAPFHTERDRALPYPGVAAVLQELVRNGRTRVVIISGREASDAIPLLGIHPCPEVWGLHGLQRVKPNGKSEISELDESISEALAVADRWLEYQRLQHTAEFKPGSIAVHWRGQGECEAEAVRGRVLLGWTSIADHFGLDLLEFDGGVEIRPPHADKGDAVRTLLQEVAPDTPAAYLGDDNTDEPAFRVINGRGLSVLVRPRWRETAAQSWLRPPQQLLDFLTQWLHACRRQGESGAATAAAVKG